MSNSEKRGKLLENWVQIHAERIADVVLENLDISVIKEDQIMADYFDPDEHQKVLDYIRTMLVSIPYNDWTRLSRLDRIVEQKELEGKTEVGS